MATTSIPKPNFSPDQVADLRRLGLTRQQVFWLRRNLPMIVEDIHGPAPMTDVRDGLDELQKHLKSLNDLLAKMWRAPRSSGKKEAAGWLGIAAAELELSCSDLDAPSVLHELTATAGQIVRRAQQLRPQRQRPRISGWRAIQRIHDAIHRPIDEESKRLATSINVSRSGKFAEIARIVFDAAIKGQEHNEIRDERHIVAIRRFLEIQRKKVVGG